MGNESIKSFKKQSSLIMAAFLNSVILNEMHNYPQNDFSIDFRGLTHRCWLLNQININVSDLHQS